jgi:hypothetical protein
MANCHSLFQDYNGKIKLSDAKRVELIAVRDNLRARIINGYNLFSRSIAQYHKIEFQSQGSFVMDTIIAPIHDDYDLDDGVYFIGNLSKDQRPAPKIFHEYIIRAIDRGYDDIEKIVDKETCVRVIYKQGFHVDIPIYYADNLDHPDLANKASGWILSNPIEFIVWFEEQIQSGFKKAYLLEAAMYDEYRRWITDIRKRDHQLRKVVRYLKSWGDLRREEMPCGLIMTILATNNYHPHERDDISLKETLVNIQATLQAKFVCERPTTPKGEDLFKSYENKDAFMNYLGQFIENAKKALEEPNQKTACAHWQKSLGIRFSCENAINNINVNIGSAGLAAGAASSRPWGKTIR